ncbi:MAG: sulfurtransferase TusA family protein [Actinobacteria bacterium]|nr:sulfurtransferase TusA family protein [Actinomycetota bacterium]MDP2211773.1 sulfurtransferase TusA family protein [Candidatus Aquicultor sp.]
MQADEVLNAQGDVCPMPILKTKKAMDKLSTGQVLLLQSTDPGSHQDLVSWCERTGNKLVKHEEKDGVYSYWVEKK